MAEPLEPPPDDAPPRGELQRPRTPRAGAGNPGGRIPPHNIQAEESLLGAMMLSRDAIAAAVQQVSAGDFYKPAHAHVFEAISTLYGAGQPVDGVTVAEQLSRSDLFDAIGGAATLAHLQASTPATSNASHYAKIVEEHSLMRKLIGVAGEISDIGYSQPEDVEKAVDHAESMVFQVAERKVTDTLAPIHSLMEGSLDRLEALYERGDSITGVATGFHDLDEILAGLQDSALVVIGARPAMGKCVAWDTPIVDPTTGAVRTAAELHRQGAAGEHVEVLSLDQSTMRIARRVPSAFVDDGIKPVFEVTTRLGRSVRTTASHPFLTGAGWRPLAQLGVGDRVAVPRALPVFGHDALPDAEVVMLAYLIGDGSLTSATPKFTNADPAVIAEIGEAAATIGAELRVEGPAGKATTFRIATDRGRPNPVLDLVRRHGLHGCDAHAKRVPEAVFRLPRRQVALFLSRLFSTDGSAWWSDAGDGYGRISYCTVSDRLAHDVQHLLLRFGLNARIRTKQVKYGEGRNRAFEIELMGRAEIESFAQQIGIFGKERQVDHLVGQMSSKGLGATRDTLPVDVWNQVLAAKGATSWAEVSERTGRPRNHNWHVHRRSPRRDTIGALATALADPQLDALASSDIYWDEIVAIEFVGHQQVYDLTVPVDHNFIASDVFVHNTALGLGMAATAALEAQRPVLLFSLEMSHLELTQRMLCSEARVDSKRIRTGNLQEADWSKISHAVGRLGDAPIWIDDNPNLTVMEIRAKARRLKAKIGDLGLVIVDYLQLMTGRNGAESRQVEVSEISRGLKILARELETPVVALSQLSRGLESRTDKRPMLADLRESGCLTADSRIVRADTGVEVTMGELLASGERNIPVWTLDERYRLVRGEMSHVFPSGTKRVYELTMASGRRLQASGNHPFLRIGGWTPVDGLAVGDHVAVARNEPSPLEVGEMSNDELKLLGHLIGDGCTLARHAVQYTTIDPENVAAVTEAARTFGVDARIVRDSPEGRGGWFQVFLPAPQRLARGRRNPIAAWLDELGVWDRRSHEKLVPDAVFGQTNEGVALFLRHLWATDGTVCIGGTSERPTVAIAYSTTSRRLADDVVRLLARLDIQARISRLRQGDNRPIHQVTVSAAPNQRRFIELVGGHGARAQACTEASVVLAGRAPNTNVDAIPAEAWGLVRKAMTEHGVTTRGLAAGLDMQYCGSALYKSGLSRDRMRRVAEIVPDRILSDLAESDVLWDRIVAIEDRGEQPVFDATVEGTHNFMANGIVVHNSIEQDADVVLFLYRDEVYDPESPHRGTAEIIVSKHRNGPTGVARVAFLPHFTRFENMAKGV